MRLLLLPIFLLVLGAPGCQNVRSQRFETDEVPAHLVPDMPLRQTRWVPRELGGRPVAIPEGSQEPYLLIRSAETAEGHGGCNRFQGSISSSEVGELTFGPLRTTRMSCPALNAETAFTRALEQTRAYRIVGNSLWLYDAGASQLARLEAGYSK